MRFSLALALVLLVTGCGSDSDSDSKGGSGGSGGSTGGSGGSTGGTAGNGGTTGGTGGGSGGSSGSGGTATGGTGGASGSTGAPTAAELLALLGSCNEVSTGDYQTDDESSSPANIPICGLTGAVFWQADMDVDCDGKQSAECNLSTDPAYLPETSAEDSNGDPLDAAALPFVVVPLPSSRFDYGDAGLQLGSVIAVIYDGKVQYGVFGDEGPSNIIGEASYAMANSLGIDPDPSTGGIDSGVSYIAFTGGAAVQAPIEDHAGATTLGEPLAKQLLQQN